MKRMIALILTASISFCILCSCRNESAEVPDETFAETETAYPFDGIAENADPVETLSFMLSKDVIVFSSYMCSSGGELWRPFFEKVEKGESAAVYIVNFFDGKTDAGIYGGGYNLYLSRLEFDGEQYKITTECRGNHAGEKFERSYKYMKIYNDITPINISYTAIRSEYCVLTNDADAEWEDINNGALFDGIFDLTEGRYVCFFNMYSVNEQDKLDPVTVTG
ncbi:MAG: hypothetical protein IJT70_04505 [Clostridia bacterium]|nr:hypothetical protein [Clostridia bacterium]